MKIYLNLMPLFITLIFIGSASGQEFHSGSTGERGDVIVSTDTVWDIPDNGQFHFNSLVVQSGARLTFRKPTNGLNPPVYFLALSNITINGTYL